MTTSVWQRAMTLAERNPVWVAPEETLRGVTRILWAQDVGAALVGAAGHLEGVISERDVLAALAHGGDPDKITAAAVMTPDVISVRPGDSLYDAAVEMLDRGIRHVPLVDAAGAVSGVVSLRDLLRPLLVDSLSG